MVDGNRRHIRNLAAALGALAISGCLAAGAAAHAPDHHASAAKKKKPRAPLSKDFEVVRLADGFRRPTSVDWTPDGTMLVSEQPGIVWSVAPDGIRSQLLNISDHVARGRERGLGTIEVAADFEVSRRLYLSYAYQSAPAKPGGPQAMRLTYVTLNPDGSLANPAAPETVVLGKDATRPCPPASNALDCPPSIATTHQGGTVISDGDGTLWIGWGDNNLPSNPGKQTFRTYDAASTAGKILHVDGFGRGLPGHAFCPGNDDLSDTCTKIYARGFRNPFRFSLSLGGRPLVSDVGWNEREEIDLAEKGDNYGWPCFEGRVKTEFYREIGRCKALYRRRKQEHVKGPLLDYPNPPTAFGAAVIMGPRYPGGAYPDTFDGSYFWGDYAQGFIKLLRLTGDGPKTTPIATGYNPVHFNIAPSGNIAFVDFRDKAIKELVYARGNKAPQARIVAQPTSGPAPLAVAFSAATSSDPEGDALAYDWDFGDGSPHAATQSAVHTYPLNGSYPVRLTVTDPSGAKSVARQTITVGNTAPTATILAPEPGTLARGGEGIALLATGSDAENGTLPPGAFSWDVSLVHKAHVHPLGIFSGSSAEFQPVRDHDADSYYVIELAVTDSAGLRTTLSPVTVRPDTSGLKIGSSPKGVPLSYGGRPIKAGRRFDAAVGFRANLSAPETIRRHGVTYRFKEWSQGGKRVQVYEVPDKDATIQARYKPG